MKTSHAPRPRPRSAAGRATRSHRLRPQLLLALPAVLTFAVAAHAQTPLTLEQRIACRERVEDVYWAHRIWPKENKEPKPARDVVTPRAVIAARLEESLRYESMLETVQEPLSPEVLQAEMDRQAKNTRDAATLRELRAALGNDPELVAECLVAPELAERRIKEWYANDRGIHAAARERAEKELAGLAAGARRSGSGEASDLVWVKRDGAAAETTFKPEAMALSPEEWDQVTSRLALALHRPSVREARGPGVESASFDSAPLGTWTRLQENQDAFFVQKLRSRSSGRARVITVRWPKVSFEAWWAQARRDVPMPAPRAARYRLTPVVGSSGCGDGTWKALAFDSRVSHSAVWTGSEMIVWGGEGADQSPLATGGRYTPATDTWAATSTGSGVPLGRSRHTAVWTGTEMIVWGGFIGYAFHPFMTDTGGRYTPGTDSWVPTGTGANLPEERFDHTAVWTGSEMIVWGGNGAVFVNTGGRYAPATDSWAATSSGPNVPSVRAFHTAVWTGTEMIVWGGETFDPIIMNTGGRYTPGTDSWVATSTAAGVPDARARHTAVWTGTEMIVWGGSTDALNDIPTNTGGRYTPGTNSWVATSIGTNVPAARRSHTAVWTGSEMIVWGGTIFDKTGGRYTPATNTWTVTNAGAGAPGGRIYHTAVWTGTEMIVWGGHDFLNGGYLTGGRYAPASDQWMAMSRIGNAPPERQYHTAVWTGAEMIVWGGYNGSSTFNSGARYTPATDSWLATSTGAGVPSARWAHQAVWTGTAMIVWGGVSGAGYENTGGRYVPATNSWTPTSTSGLVPAGRRFHTTVWTGSEMIVWGGSNGSYVNTGGRYSPGTNAWVATDTSGPSVPSGRHFHTAVWTGSEMIVWGGLDGSTYVNTGGRYTPGTNTWTATDTSGPNVPDARQYHTAVWTGSQMIVWGGSNGSYENTGGRYTPATNSWTATDAIGANVPTVRAFHTAVWTGGEMIVWGGYGGAFENTGGRFEPGTNSWRPTSTTGAVPSGRYLQTAVWTGDQVMVWGGWDGSHYLPDGGAYCALYPGSAFTVPPCRLLDTRTPADGPALTSGVARLVPVVGHCQIAASAKALSVNITVTNPTGQGFINAYPGDQAPPVTSILNFSAGQTRANNAVVGLATDGSGTLAVKAFVAGSGTVDVIIDVTGFIE